MASSDRDPVPSGRTVPVTVGLAAGGLAGGFAVAVALFFLGRAVVRFVADHTWQVAVIGALVLALAAAGAMTVYVRRQQAAAREARLRRYAHLEKIDALSGRMFEEYVADLLRRDGHRNVQRVGQAGDRGVDVLARTRDGRKLAVQCKRQAKTVGSDRVRNLIGAVHGTYTGHTGVLVTSSTFTRPAREEAADMIVLIDRDTLAAWIDGQSPDL